MQDETTKTWLPAAGTFDAWPKSASLIRLIDPCMGSGHFLVFALPLLVRLRMEEEKLNAQAAVVAALRDNIHGLELDERCTQIAAFNVALTSWKLAGYQALPPLHLACSGLAPSGLEAEWVALAGKNDRLRRGMMRLHSLFKEAPMLGSLINPRAQAGDLIEAEFHELAPLLAAAVAVEEKQTHKLDDDAVELGVIAQGLTKAAELLAGRFNLVITNVPYLGQKKQCDSLKEYCERVHPDAKADLATCFIERSIGFCVPDGSTGLVTPQNWLFMGKDEDLRRRLLPTTRWDFVARLGARAFETITGEVVNVVLFQLTWSRPDSWHTFAALDVSSGHDSAEKARRLPVALISEPSQLGQVSNPNARITIDKISSDGTKLVDYCSALAGAKTGDMNRFTKCFWEIPASSFGGEWELYQTAPRDTVPYSAQEMAVFWQNEQGEMYELAQSVKHLNHVAQNWLRGKPNWKKRGVVVGLMAEIPAAIYSGEIYDSSCCALIPTSPDNLLALWAFCESGQYSKEIRRIDQALNIGANTTLLQVPFDLTHWQEIAAEKYPDGLPKPHSDDPTQWIFNGHPAGSAQSLHVAVARILGYRWPRQIGSSFPDCPALGSDGLEKFADEDGIVCLPAVNREQPAAARLRQLLTAALGTFDERALITSAGLKGSKTKTLEDWLRDEFFEQHAKLFHDRPFIWHLWDGLPDGFHALVNYHRLDHANLQKLTYSYLGDWIQQQAEDTKADKPGAAERLGAARSLQNKLAAILEGEAPLDIFVRWKPVKEQAQGWHPDLNDGIRQNIRPFLLAGDVGKRGAGLFRTCSALSQRQGSRH